MRAGNVIGGGDFAPDRIIPDCIRNTLAGQPIVVRNPNSVRPYQHVLEPLMAYLLVAIRQIEDHTLAGSYNIGPDEADCVTTAQLADLFCSAWGSGASWIHHGELHAPHEANLLRLDCSKLKSAFSWRPLWHVSEAIQQTIAWTKIWQMQESIMDEMSSEIQAYQLQMDNPQ